MAHTKKLQSFAKKIRAFRKAQGISQAQLAKKAKVSNITISKIESGDNDNPTIKTLQNIGKVLRVSITDIVG